MASPRRVWPGLMPFQHGGAQPSVKPIDGAADGSASELHQPARAATPRSVTARVASQPPPSLPVRSPFARPVARHRTSSESVDQDVTGLTSSPPPRTAGDVRRIVSRSLPGYDGGPGAVHQRLML